MIYEMENKCIYLYDLWNGKQMHLLVWFMKWKTNASTCMIYEIKNKCIYLHDLSNGKQMHVSNQKQHALENYN